MPRKPLILVFPFGLLSHYLRSMMLCSSVRSDADFIFQSDPAFEGFLRDGNWPVFSAKNLNPKVVLEHAARFDFSWMKSPEVEEVMLAQYRIITEMKPDAVMGDASFTLKMAAARAGVPFISLCNAYMTPEYARVRKLSRTHRAYPQVQKLPPAAADKITAFAEKIALRAVHKPFRRLRKKHRLPVTRNWLSEFSGDVTLLCDLPDIFPQRSLPAGVFWTGPLSHHPEEKLPGEVIDFLQTGSRAMVVSLGSSGDWKALEVLNEQNFSSWRIVTAGAPEGLFHAPHILSQKFLNLAAAAQHADLLLCHGGNGTMYLALEAGAPVLCHSNHFEQEWNADAFGALDLCASLPPVFSGEELLKSAEQRAAQKPAEEWKRKMQEWNEEKRKSVFIAALRTLNLLS